MLDIIAKVLIMALIFVVLGLFIHIVKYIFSASYRNEIREKKILKNQINEYLTTLDNVNNSEDLFKKVSLTKSLLTINLDNYKEFTLNSYNTYIKKFPEENTLITLINACIYVEKGYELKNCMNDLIKKNISEEINTELKFGTEILEKHNKLKEKYKNINYEFIIYNSYRFQISRLLKNLRSELIEITDNIKNQNNEIIIPNIENILDRLDNENGFEIYIKDLIKNNKPLKEVLNLMIMINAYEKISMYLTLEIKKLSNNN
ncbi:hypothetical protein [Flavobacterium macrobrachii]|jgi:hypothetical protein|uniref:hypothetical protein n=1 Tax=Flavobacterium macrobrachii TaxID=591204 RepID=UPI0037BE5729